MESRTVTIRGNVQKVGLRIQISDIAKKLGVCGWMENVGDGSVLIVCEAERQVLDEMMQQIKRIPEPVTIEDMTVKASPATGMSGFRILTHEINEEVTAAIRAGTAQLKKMGKTLNNMDQSQREIVKTLNNMDQSQREIVKTLNNMDQSQREIVKTLNNMDQSQREIVKTLNNMDQRLNNMDQSQRETVETLASIRDTLVSMDGKMDKSLNNDAQILEILGSMRAGGMLRIPE